MSRVGFLVCALLAACGRIGFEVRGGIGDDNDAAMPRYTRRSYIKAPAPQTLSQFGLSVAVSGDGSTIAAAAPLEDVDGFGEAGAVHVYRRSDASWQYEGRLVAPNREAFDQFGWSISLSADGNTLVAGARREDSSGLPADNSVMSAGAVYVFTRADTWSFEAYVKPAVTGQGDAFGERVSISADGNTLVVASIFEDSGSRVIDAGATDESATDAGAAYIFTRAGTTWTQQAYLKASNADAVDEFGGAVGISADGNTVAIGARRERSASMNPTDNSAMDAGAAFVFVRVGTTWTEHTYLKAPMPTAGDTFGYALALASDGSRLAIGCMGEANGAGAVHAYTGSDMTWSGATRLAPASADANDELGFSVAASEDGTTIAAGAIAEAGPANALPGSGALHVFGAAMAQSFTAASPDSGDNFGWAVALSSAGDVLVVGAPFEDSNAAGIDGDATNNALVDSGAVYVIY